MEEWILYNNLLIADILSRGFAKKKVWHLEVNCRKLWNPEVIIYCTLGHITQYAIDYTYEDF